MNVRLNALTAANYGNFANAIEILSQLNPGENDGLSAEVGQLLRLELVIRDGHDSNCLDVYETLDTENASSAVLIALARAYWRFGSIEQSLALFRQASQRGQLCEVERILLRIVESRLESGQTDSQPTSVGQSSSNSDTGEAIYDLLLGDSEAKSLPKRDIFHALVNFYASPAAISHLLRNNHWPGSLTAEAIVREYSDRDERYKIIDALHTLPSYKPSKKWGLVIARRLEARKAYDEALTFLKAYGEPAQNDYDHNLLLGSIYDRAKDSENAMLYLGRANALRTGSVSLVDRLLRLEYDAFKKDPLRARGPFKNVLKKKLEMCQRALLTNPKEPRLRHNLARALFYSENYRDAEQILTGLSAEEPDNASILWDLIRVLRLRKRDPLVIRAKIEAMAKLDNNIRVKLAYCESLREAGESLEALVALGQDWEANETTAFEYIRTLFFIGEFAQAEIEALRLAVAYPESMKFHMLMAAASLEAGRAHNVILDNFPPRSKSEGHLDLELPLIKYAIARQANDFETSLPALDPIFTQLGTQVIRSLSDPTVDEFDRLIGSTTNGVNPNFANVAENGPLVSVIMTTYNVADYVRTAVRSILQQSYKNLELIIVDDLSTDGTRTILKELEKTDERVRVVLKSTNDGTYVSKNTGILHSLGDIIALQDADDWSHPDRIALSVASLLSQKELIGLTTDWFRMTSDGVIVIKAGGQIAHGCCISLVFHRHAIERVGFFDSVRIAADLEYIERLTLAFGAFAVARLRMPLLFGRARSGSLTASEEFGITRTGFTQPRQLYHHFSRDYHDKIADGDSPFMRFPLAQRTFPAPNVILP